jgi:two-component system KDP operon response regulator KdpE
MSKILAIDDEPAILRLLTTILVRAGHEVVGASDARAARSHLEQAQFDAAVLDLGLPDRNGLELISAIREKHSLPIIVLTARSETSEKIAALDLGADDYVTKPFDGDELLARLRAALRRPQNLQSSDEPVAFGSIAVDSGRHSVTVAGKPVALTPREFAVLRELVHAQGRVLTHPTLLERVWGKAHAEDVDYLRVVIRALRLKVEINPSAPNLIRNEPGVGYRLCKD